MTWPDVLLSHTGYTRGGCGVTQQAPSTAPQRMKESIEAKKEKCKVTG